ncbi:hypothetical protein Pint_13897 [Pistacia integerrima]|uniref:Uncharacterized protein n=1 Tax=Pistacia integerrima TaxID=434235 RepID=A0ACC0Y4H7_9ROSI|nr:hypothetical protein Pint_13897 [Pistacia integerrima]
MIVLGKAADGRIQREFEELANLVVDLSEELSHMLYAAADMVLVPSIYEPCGLAQMIVVRKTGGLVDTVFDMDDLSNHEMANGFVFEGIEEGSLNSALDRAFRYYRDKPDECNSTVQEVMEIDNSWNNTAGKYVEIYNSVTVPWSKFDALESRSLSFGDDISRFLDLLHVQKLDIPRNKKLMITTRMISRDKDDFERPPKLKWHKVLWAIQDLDRKWLLLQKRKSALESYYKKRFEEESRQIYDETRLALNEQLFDSISKSLKAAESEREVDGVDSV